MLKHGRKLSSIVLALLLLCMTVLIAAPQNVLAAEGQPKIVGERVDLREENVKAYQLDNGQIQCDIYPIDIFYRDTDGKLKDIDNTIKAALETDNYILTNTANSWRAYFKDSIGEENAITIKKDKYALEFYLIGSNESIVQKSNSITDPRCDFEKSIAEDNRAVIYKNVFANVDIAYTVFTSALKEDIILRDKSAATTFQFHLKTEGLKLIDKQGKTKFVDEYGNDVFAIDPMYMEDACGKRSDAVSYKIDEDINGYIITITSDTDFINAPDTVFPVRIDPTYVTTGTDYTSDTYVADRYDGTIDRRDDNYYLDDDLRTGKDTTYGVRRTYLRFKLPSGYEYGGITSAELQLRLKSKGTGANDLSAWSVEPVDTVPELSNSYWRSNEITWLNKPYIYYTDEAPITDDSTSWYKFNVLDQIKDCYYETTSNFGFIVKDSIENNTNVWCTFYSSDSSSTSYLPRLSITYTDITDYQYWSGNWVSGVADDLVIYKNTALFNNNIDEAWNLWNGINSNVNVDSKSGTSTSHNIEIKQVYWASATQFGKTRFYYQGNEVFPYPPYNAPTWDSVVIELNSNSSSLQTFHDDLISLIILHELGHAIGLAHVNAFNNDSSICVMQQNNFYSYVQTTSHDRQTVNDKY